MATLAGYRSNPLAGDQLPSTKVVDGSASVGQGIWLDRRGDSQAKSITEGGLLSDGGGMSDFLTRMAQLSRGEATVVAPRISSLFAPLEGAGLAETLDTELQQQNKAEPLVKTTQQPAVVTGDTELPQSTAHDEPTKGQPISFKPTTRQDYKSEDADTPLVAPLDNNHAVPTIAASLGTKNQDTSAITQQESSHRHTASSENDAPQTIAKTNVDMPFDSVINQNGQPDGAMPQQSLPLVLGYKSKQLAPEQVMAELPITTVQAAKQEPTVHINIGRVEVRALTTSFFYRCRY